MGRLFFDAYTCFGRRRPQYRRDPHSLEVLLEEMAHCSISGALVSCSKTLHHDAMHENLRLVETLSPYDHLFPIWNVIPHWTGEFPEPEALSSLMRSHGVQAVTAWPKLNEWDLLAPTSRPLLEQLARDRTLLILNVSQQVSLAEIETLATTHPDLPILMRYASWKDQRRIVPMMLHQENLHLGFDRLHMNRGLEWFVTHGCEDRLLYCSNATEMSMGQRSYVDYAEVSEAVKDKIAGGNLTRLLGGLRPPREQVNETEDALMAEARRGEPLSCLVLDAHAHILDEGLQGGGGPHVMFEGGPTGVWRQACRMGVDGIGFMSWNGTVGCQADDGQATVKAALDALPSTCWGLFTPDPCWSRDEMLAKAEQCFADQRFLGLKPYQSYDVHYDNPVYDPLWEFATRRGLYALLHPQRQDLSELDVLCAQYPRVTFLLAHAASTYERADRAIVLANKYPNFYMEITYTNLCLGIIDYLAEHAGAERVLYGTDLPMRDPRQQLGWIVFSRLSIEAKKRILGLNTQAMRDRIRAQQAALT